MCSTCSIWFFSACVHVKRHDGKHVWLEFDFDLEIYSLPPIFLMNSLMNVLYFWLCSPWVSQASYEQIRCVILLNKPQMWMCHKKKVKGWRVTIVSIDRDGCHLGKKPISSIWILLTKNISAMFWPWKFHEIWFSMRAETLHLFTVTSKFVKSPQTQAKARVYFLQHHWEDTIFFASEALAIPHSSEGSFLHFVIRKRENKIFIRVIYETRTNKPQKQFVKHKQTLKKKLSSMYNDLE